MHQPDERDEAEGTEGMDRRDIRTALRDRVLAARRDRDTSAVEILRIAQAAIENAEAQPMGAESQTHRHMAATSHAGSGDVARRAVSDTDARHIVEAEVASLGDAARRYSELGQREAAERCAAQAHVLQSVLES